MKWWLGFVALLCQAQQELPPDLAILAKIKVQEAQNLSQLPNYICSETIERWVKRPPANPSLLDTLHLEVAYVDGRELYGLAGAPRIDQAEITKLVHGTIGGGAFATIVNEILHGPGATFHFEGSTELDGKSAVLYTFHVARFMSGFRIITQAGNAVLGYRGKFWADPSTFDLIRLELLADDIPSALQLSAASEWIEYRKVPIGGSIFLLPQSSEMTLADAAGNEGRNHTSYQACHQFVAESVLSFAGIPVMPGPGSPGKAPATSTQPGNPGAPKNLPDEFTVDINLETPIDSDSAKAGDPVSAILRQPIKVEKTTFVPKGATLTGRITKIDNDHDSYTVDLSFTSLDFKDGHAELGQRKNEVLILVTTRIPTPVSGPQGTPMEQVTDTPSPLVFKIRHLKLKRGTHLILHSTK